MWLDLLIILLVIGGIYRGWTSGFLQQFWSSAGFFGGLLVGRWLEPHTLQLAHTTQSRALITLITFLGSALFFMTLGEYIGIILKRRLRGQLVNRFDSVLGSLISVVAAVFSIWLLASIAATLPYNGLQNTVRNSYIISGLNRVLPPAPNIIANIGKLIDPNGFPDVFIGNEPIPSGRVNLPQLGEFTDAVNADKDSVVRIKGQGCGGIVSGSGFVVGDGLVATNAHVVAGINNPYVQDVNGNHRSTVIWFDPALDFAVLRASGLAGQPLSILDDKVADGTPVAVLGYPEGGNFSAGPAAVLNQILASGRDIYGRGNTVRDIYEIQATVVPGNSGGPLIDKDGTVIGVVFAQSTTYDQVGYALTTPKVISEIQQAQHRTQPVGTGQCAE